MIGKKLRLGEVVKLHGRSTSFWRSECDRGNIPFIKLPSGERLIDSEDIVNYWDAHKQPAEN